MFRKKDTTDTKKAILAMDGGGIRGLISLGFIKHGEELLHKIAVIEQTIAGWTLPQETTRI